MADKITFWNTLEKDLPTEIKLKVIKHLYSLEIGKPTSSHYGSNQYEVRLYTEYTNDSYEYFTINYNGVTEQFTYMHDDYCNYIAHLIQEEKYTSIYCDDDEILDTVEYVLENIYNDLTWNHINIIEDALKDLNIDMKWKV